MLVFVGDSHGWFRGLQKAARELPEDATIIHVGDLGFWPHLARDWKKYMGFCRLGRPIYFIDGNHEYLPKLMGLKEETEVWPGLIYLPRGTIKEIEGIRVGFCGGAGSIDYKSRALNIDWFLEEAITQQDLDHFRGAQVDLLVTHCPPASVVKAVCNPFAPKWYGLEVGWIDPSSKMIEGLRESLGNPPMVCGHLHTSALVDGVKVLDINEIWEYRHD
jgi:Icc-related predicted phosphoesterase